MDLAGLVHSGGVHAGDSGRLGMDEGDREEAPSESQWYIDLSE